MKIELAQELLNELGSSLENLEAQHGALLQFLKDKGVVPEAEFAPYLDQAGRTSSVRWRASRVRLERLFSAEEQERERAAEKEKLSTGQDQASDQGPQKGLPPENEESSNAPPPQGEEGTTNTEAKSARPD